MIRLGYTESTLLFFFYLDNFYIIDKNLYIDQQNNLINYLYSTSGFYDKKIDGDYFNFNTEIIKKSEIYNKYFTKILYFLKNYNFNILLCFHNVNENLLVYKDLFLEFLNYNNKINKYTNIFEFMENKNILILNNLGSLMKQQFESGNIHKICPSFSKNVKSIQYFENGYSFCNSGMDENILETFEKLTEKFQNFNFDGVVISCGAYSILLAEYIIHFLKKDVFLIGGDLPNYFGIITNRGLYFNKNDINEYFINVPENMKPINYEKIENGCYW
jgi:hypothetical protein